MSLKNITIFLIIFFLWVWSVFADDVIWESRNPDVLWVDPHSTQSVINWRDPNMSYDAQTILNPDWTITQVPRQEWSASKSSPVQFNCTKWTLCSDSFMIPTSKFSPGWAGLNKASSKATINGFFTVLIKKLMVALWSLALIIMVVWAGFMITAMWKDDSLNKWKTIFKAWIIALAIAMSSYFMVSFLSYILYS